jgi:hypothetical protein
MPACGRSRPSDGGETFAPTDFADLVNEAAAIVHGRVIATRGIADGRARVDVRTIDVSRSKATSHEPVIRVPGGQLGRYRDVVIGAPRLNVGDDVILFLSTRGGGAPHVLGLMLGVFRVRHDGGQALVSPAPALATDGTPRRIVRGSRAQAPIAIASFSALVDGRRSPTGTEAAMTPRPCVRRGRRSRSRSCRPRPSRI